MISGQLNSVWTGDFVKSFHANCLSLISDAHTYLVENKIVTVDFDEEQISAKIFTYIDETYSSISVADERRLYDSDVLNGTKKAKNVAKIDLVFSVWNKNKKHRFWVEAKNLIENDCKKTGRKSPLSASRLQRRYITTGIDNFVGGTYPQPGCVLGYVLEGRPMQIADKVNAILCADTRAGEQLSHSYSGINGLSHYFQSSHSGNLYLRHYWIDFTQHSTL